MVSSFIKKNLIHQFFSTIDENLIYHFFWETQNPSKSIHNWVFCFQQTVYVDYCIKEYKDLESNGCNQRCNNGYLYKPLQ